MGKVAAPAWKTNSGLEATDPNSKGTTLEPIPTAQTSTPESLSSAAAVDRG